METKKITLDLWDYTALIIVAASGWAAVITILLFNAVLRNS